MLRVRKYIESEDTYKLLSCIHLKDSNISETFKILNFMKENEIPLFINDGVADSLTSEECFIEEVCFEVPNIGINEMERTCECIIVDVI